MEIFKNKYNNLYNDIFTEKENQKLCPTIEEKIDDYPEPTKYRISTMTMITSFNCNINLEVVSRYFKLDDKIMSMVYGDKPVKSSFIKKTNRPFFNQATIIVKLDPLRNINIKIFSNGKIQMTGVKKKIDGEIALKLIIEKLKITSGEVPLKNLLDSQLISYYLDITGKDVVEKSYYELDKTGKIIFLKEQMIEKIYEIKETKEINLFAESIENKNNIKIEDIDIVLINSDFNINFKIKRNNLFNILTKNYNIVTRYEPGIYPGVNSKYYWNKAYENHKFEGKCYCTKKCTGKGKGNGDGDCKKITIAAFQSGSVIITGAREILHIEKAKNFINRVFKENYDLIKKIDAHFIEKITENKPKKYIKTSDIIYINKDKLNNPLNKGVYEKYLNYISNFDKNN
uniref:Transcription factor TFIID n=1 Tax=Mimiviridae sp. ChoanoV1 TaxID=2596887 RepID=A0A5B8IQX1_9VIRU|nr:transcription factor TFIID [Mimiviridae sp. ChoanoV1]